MGPAWLNQPGYVTGPIRDLVSDLHYHHGMTLEPDPDDEPLRRFANQIREAREYRGWSQDDLAERAGVSRPTINRYEQGKTRMPEVKTARAIFIALKLDPRRIPVLLGYVTEEEMGLPADAARMFHATTEEAITILEDPRVDPRKKAEWVEFLRFRAEQDSSKGRRQAG
jgi:transcriptional regulator with XRE-family HTH domain